MYKIFFEESKKYAKVYSSNWQSEKLTFSPSIDNGYSKAFLEYMTKERNEEIQKRKNELNEKYLKEKQRYFHYFKYLSEASVDKIFAIAANFISQINYKGVAIEITPYNSIFIELILDDNSNIHIKLILDDLINVRIFFARYKDGQCLDSTIASYREIFEKLSEIANASELPGNSFA